jgi:hypothetical protein
MIKVPGNLTPDNSKYHKTAVNDDSFDPTRDDWSRHEEDAKGSNRDGVGFLDEDDFRGPGWYHDENEDEEDDESHFYRAL